MKKFCMVRDGLWKIKFIFRTAHHEESFSVDFPLEVERENAINAILATPPKEQYKMALELERKYKKNHEKKR